MGPATGGESGGDAPSSQDSGNYDPVRTGESRVDEPRSNPPPPPAAPMSWTGAAPAEKVWSSEGNRPAAEEAPKLVWSSSNTSSDRTYRRE
jgi:hypothetical protein